MKKEPANNHLQFEKRASMSEREARFVFFGVSAAMAVGVIINPEVIESLAEAQNVLGTYPEHKDQRPPKPPRRPNARIGGMALGST